MRQRNERAGKIRQRPKQQRIGDDRPVSPEAASEMNSSSPAIRQSFFSAASRSNAKNVAVSILCPPRPEDAVAVRI